MYYWWASNSSSLRLSICLDRNFKFYLFFSSCCCFMSSLLCCSSLDCSIILASTNDYCFFVSRNITCFYSNCLALSLFMYDNYIFFFISCSSGSADFSISIYNSFCVFLSFNLRNWSASSLSLILNVACINQLSRNYNNLKTIKNPKDYIK